MTPQELMKKWEIVGVLRDHGLLPPAVEVTMRRDLLVEFFGEPTDRTSDDPGR